MENYKIMAMILNDKWNGKKYKKINDNMMIMIRMNIKIINDWKILWWDYKWMKKWDYGDENLI